MAYRSFGASSESICKMIKNRRRFRKQNTSQTNIYSNLPRQTSSDPFINFLFNGTNQLIGTTNRNQQRTNNIINTFQTNNQQTTNNIDPFNGNSLLNTIEFFNGFQ
ncbi:hypothetical protein RCL_jg21433.t1 [Rhizophagus clarus]|uniref:Uncharacterized protein n=1 Tax=Rhizophagus clarus TaxID=94130 RepID=A0A8H3LVH1_9GLOM|nr:hypothetical protein RCL_jg21433.t1 [Rhizophagus clarus]